MASLETVDYSDTVNFWLSSTRWSNLPMKVWSRGSSGSGRSKRSSRLALLETEITQKRLPPFIVVANRALLSIALDQTTPLI
jgi:hypothetical protein